MQSPFFFSSDLTAGPDVLATEMGLVMHQAGSDAFALSQSSAASAGSAPPPHDFVAAFVTQHASASDQQFVGDLYHTVLGRDVDAAGLQFWNHALASGESRADIVTGVAASPEFQQHTATAIPVTVTIQNSEAAAVSQLYYAALDRAPDAEGLRNWVQALASGESLQDIASGIVNSAEFQATHGRLDDSHFVEQLYHTILGREADGQGQAAWTAALTHESRGQVVLDFLNSPEAQHPPSLQAISGAVSTDLGQLVLRDASDALTTAHTATASPVAHTSVAPAPTAVGNASTGLQLNLIWDTSVASAPSGFMSAVVQAAQFYATHYSNHEVLNLHVGYGEVNSHTLPSNAAAASMNYGYLENYATIRSALAAHATNTADTQLPATDPTHGGSFFVSTAEAKALGQVSATGASVDGFIGVSNVIPFSTSANHTAVAQGTYDLIGAVEHEISEVMGRIGSLGSALGSNVYTPLDLLRYTASGVHDLTPASGYFSVDGGHTNLGLYNNPLKGGDTADWAPSVSGDAYGYAALGTLEQVTQRDLIENNVLGYHLSA